VTAKQAWSIAGIILIGENRSTQDKTCPSATLPTKKAHTEWPGIEPKPPGGRPAINHLNHGVASGFLNDIACNVKAHFMVVGQ